MKNIKNLYWLIFLALFSTVSYKLDAFEAAEYKRPIKLHVTFTRGFTTRAGFNGENPTKEDLQKLIQSLQAETVCVSMPEYNRVYFDITYSKNGRNYDNGIIGHSNDQATKEGQESIENFNKKVEKIIGYLEKLLETAP